MTSRLHIILALSPLVVSLGCPDEVDTFVPGASYTIPHATDPRTTVLSFGEVSVTAEKTLHIAVLSSGGAALKLLAPTRRPDNAQTQAKFEIETSPVLLAGLSPGRTATIAVTYRPCPEAWVGNQVNPEYQFEKCPTAQDDISLAIVDNTSAGGVEISINGLPVPPPVLEVLCPRGGGKCNQNDATLDTCDALVFSTVQAGDTPCDLVLEIRAPRRPDMAGVPKRTGPLVIESLEMKAVRVTDPEPRAVFDAFNEGFSIVDESGRPVDWANGLTIASEGSLRLKVRFDGSGSGTWQGSKASDRGLRIYSNDPSSRPVRAISFSGTGSAPNIEVWPPTINFGPVSQGSTKTATVTVRNQGDAPLRIQQIGMRVDTGGTKFRTRVAGGRTAPFEVATFGDFELYVDYSPQAGGSDSDILVIESNDSNDSPTEITVSGGAVPRIQVEPSDVLVFPLPSPPPPPPVPPRSDRLLVSNIGFGDLRIERLTLQGSDGSTTHAAVDDFSIQGCAANPCEPNVMLCAPSSPGCASSTHEFTITYANNDASNIDLVNLRIASNDPINSEILISLSAEDVPCLFPTPIMTVTSTSRAVGQPVLVSALSSQAGGDSGGSTTISTYDWMWLVTPGAPPAFSANGPGAVQISFVPPREGAYVLGLHVTNSCGARSQRPATEPISIAPQ